MTSRLRVAAAQAASVAGDVATNVRTAVALVEAAADAGARVVVLPELFLTGYDPGSWAGTAIDVADPRLRPLSEAAGSRDVVVVAGAAVRRDPDEAGRRVTTLSLVVLDDTGAVAAPYDKQHLFADEREMFTPGDRGASLVVDGWELGLGICYDGCFPSHATAAADDGARAYLCPSAYYAGSEHRRDLYYPARALDNGIYVVFSGLAGRCGDREFNGGSAVYDPEGRVLDRVGAEHPALAVADLDAEVVVRTQREHPLLRDRVTDLGGRRRHATGLVR